MGKCKAFEPGQSVEVKREPGCGPRCGNVWELAEYLKAHTDWRGHHQVKLPDTSSPRYIDAANGMELPGPDGNDRAYATRIMNVPSRRIRAKGG